MSEIKAKRVPLPDYRPMALYRIRFVDHGGRVFGTEEMECGGDAQAILKAREIHTHGIGNGYEIWQDGRLVHTEKRR